MYHLHLSQTAYFILKITGFLDVVSCPEFQMLENTTFRKLGLFPSSGEGRETLVLLGPLERANPCPDTVIEVSPFEGTQQSPSPHLKTETDPVSETFCFPVGARGSVVVKALCYKPEGRGFDTRWGEFLNLPNPPGRTRPWGLLSL
jgi:hypothetical protein